uniref:Reverse transcriptase domain-containing protein n=1 Tax=Fagus sylvatica TaxID=28930 RepID=A0A2N9HJ77_FAGSY
MALFIGGAARLARHHAARRVMMPRESYSCHVAVLSATQPLLRILLDFRKLSTSTFQRYKVCTNRSLDGRVMAPGSRGCQELFLHIFPAKIPIKRGMPPANRELHVVAGVIIFPTHPGLRVNLQRVGKTLRAKAVVREKNASNLRPIFPRFLSVFARVFGLAPEVGFRRSWCRLKAYATLSLKVLDLRETELGFARYDSANRGRWSVFGPLEDIFPIKIPARPGKILAIREFHTVHERVLFPTCPGLRINLLPCTEANLGSQDMVLRTEAVGMFLIPRGGGQSDPVFGLVNGLVKPRSNLVNLSQTWSKLSELWEMYPGPRRLGSGCLILCADTRENPGGKNGVMTDIPRIDGIHCPLRVRCQPLRELRFVQFLEEVYCATLPEFEERKEMWPEKAWNSLEAEGTLFPTTNPPFMSSNEVGVNILTWNCREVLNPCFRKALLDTLHINNPKILILTETKLGGDRAAELAQSFPFDGFLCTNTIGFAGGIWILWKTATLEVDHLCSTEQELHVSVKVRGSNSLWLLSAIYASPRRLDRVLANPDWSILFPEASVTHLTRTHSDHCPVLLTLCPHIPCILPRPFRFESIWFSHVDFLSVVEKAWATLALNLSITFAIFAAFVSAWNKSKFGNIFHRKKRILARLNGIQCALTLSPSESLSRIEKSLREDYFIFLKLEEELWALKSRVGWVVEGDRNTKFFHTSTLVRRRANKIVRLRNSVGEWIIDSDLIRLHIQQGFVGLFSTSHVHPPSGFCLPLWAPRVLDQKALSLTAHVDAKDVKMSLWSLKAFKAPGPDGLHPGFFQKCWPTVGDSVVNEVRKIFSNGRMPKYLNKTLISLIPKCLGPETLSQFRPISLCNTVYKIVTKIIVYWLRPIIGNLVSPFQVAFVPGRRGLDNVVIAQELIHSIHRKKGRLGQLILKLDLEKAYDRLEWDFIREVLTFFKFPPPFVDLVLECVTTSSFSILVNGGQLENFKPSRGIRQGDPLSPYLFILCMEYLSLKILEVCDNNSWKAIKASRSGPSFSHLFFANDLLLCVEASSDCCHTITRILEDFCIHSGQKVNLSKSKVFFSPNVNLVLRHHLSGILRVSSTPNLGKYLGFPLSPNGRSTRDFDFVVEKVQAKLSNWKAKLLSPADRKMHMISWDKVCRPKDLGGLGFYSTKSRNLALLAKLNWRVMEEHDSLWEKTLIAKYCPNGIMDERLRTKRSGSSNWKGLRKGHEVFRKGLRWVVNNGHDISFWHDLWVSDSSIRSLVHGPLSPWEDSLRVCDVVEGVSMWNFSILSLVIPTCTREAIKAISVCSNRPLADKRVWDTVGGDFKLGKAYSIACNNFSECSSLRHSFWIWKVRTSPRIMFFLWQCYQLCVPVRETLASRGINIPTFCPRCLAPNESLVHMLRDCPDSIAFWNSFRFPSVGSHFYSAPFSDWIHSNCIALSSHDHNIPWQTLFSFGIWSLWLRRNQFIFKPDSSFLDLVVNAISYASEFFYLIGSYSKDKTMISTLIKSLTERFDLCSLRHIYREANGCADLLAKAGCDQTLDFISFSIAPAYNSLGQVRDGNGVDWDRIMGDPNPPRTCTTTTRPRPAPVVGATYPAPLPNRSAPPRPDRVIVQSCGVTERGSADLRRD